MAEHQFSQSSLFMSKETFDQVSFEMWGRIDFDYHSYILSRTEWYDEDIREEAAYAMGMAHGLRLGALKETSQRIGYQNEYRDQSSALSDEGGCQLGCTSQCDPRFGRHYCYTPLLPQSMAQTPLSPPPRPVLSFSELARTPSESALQRQASMVNERFAPRQEGRDCANERFGTEHPCANTFSSSPLTPLGMTPQTPYILPPEPEVPEMNLPLGFKAFYGPVERIGSVSGAPTSPEGMNTRPSPSDSPESRLRAEIPLRQKPQSSAAGRNDKPEDSENDNEDWVDLGTN